MLLIMASPVASCLFIKPTKDRDKSWRCFNVRCCRSIDVGLEIERVFTSSYADALDAIRALGSLDSRQPFDFKQNPSSSIRKLEGLIPRPQADRCLEKLKEIELSTEIDSVDGHPSYHVNLIVDGKKVDSEELEGLLSSVEKAVYEDLLPKAREMMDNEKIVVSDVFFRRYGQYEIESFGKRRGISGHYDCFSAVTAVVALDDVAAEGSNGLFTIAFDDNSCMLCHTSCRRFFPLKRGDAVMHDWKTIHGVDVEPDKDRASLVVWFSVEGEQRRAVPSWISSGKIGDFVKGIASENSLLDGDEIHPHDLYLSSAALGNAFALNRLGGLLEEEGLSPERVVVARDLLKGMRGLPGHWALEGAEDCSTNLARKAWYQAAIRGMAMALLALGDDVMGDALWGEEQEEGNGDEGRRQDMKIFAAKCIGLAAQQGCQEGIEAAERILEAERSAASEELFDKSPAVEIVRECLKTRST